LDLPAHYFRVFHILASPAPMSLMYSIEKLLYTRNKSVPVFREYDKRRGFDDWSKTCQASTKRNARDASKDILGTQGFERVKLMSEAEARKIRASAEGSGSAVQNSKLADISQRLDLNDQSVLKSTVERLITPEVDDILFNFFGSEYCAYWYHFSRALPNKEPKRSFLWHCDKGPSMHAKMLFYMTSVEETGGNTYLLDKATTDRFDRAGYIFGSQKDRQDDLADFAERNKIQFTPFSFDLKAGEAILFLPQKVLHKGVLPTKAPRFIMQVTFLPSKIHWKDALYGNAQMSVEDLSKDYAWPKHASQLVM
jgi:hypothetical protein